MILTCLALASSLLRISMATVPECGRVFMIPIPSLGDRTSKVIGGRQTLAADWPWLVKIATSSGAFCTGAIISESDILTAGHCKPVLENASTIVYAGVDHVNLDGTYDGQTVRVKEQTPYSTAVTRTIQYFAIEPSYKYIANHSNASPGLDVAVVTLNEPLKFNENIGPVCLAKNYTEKVGESATVIGWGYNLFTESLPVTARESIIPINDPIVCEKEVAYYDLALKICAGGANRGAQPGDSGGPLMVNRGARHFHVGVVSQGYTVSANQHVLDYGIYARTALACPFIEKITCGRAKCIDMDAVDLPKSQ